jgi:hypothetical protein
MVNIPKRMIKFVLPKYRKQDKVKIISNGMTGRITFIKNHKGNDIYEVTLDYDGTVLGFLESEITKIT